MNGGMPMKSLFCSFMKKEDHKETITELEEKATMPRKMSLLQRKLFLCYSVLVAIGNLCTVYAYAAGDPLAAVDNLSTFIFSLIRAIGLILLGFGIVQVGLSLKSHDPSQRANGFLTLAGGVIITFAKEILDLIMA